MPSHIKKRIKKPKPKPKKVTVVLVDDPLIEAVRPPKWLMSLLESIVK